MAGNKGKTDVFARALGKYKDLGIFILRAGLGAMFMVAHGAGKLFGGPSQWETLGRAMQFVGVDTAPVVWGLLAAITEFFGGFFLLLGLYVRPAALAMTAVMVVASLSTYARATSWDPRRTL